jgi:predicted GNAT superfamily acetyltransferase
MNITMLNIQNPAWSTELHRAYARLDEATNNALFPYHFLRVVLANIGGHVALIQNTVVPVVVGFLFPRELHVDQPSLQRAYTLRYHAFPGSEQLDLHEAYTRLEQQFAASIVLYNPYAPHQYRASHQWLGTVDIGRPDQAEAAAIRNLQQQVWGSPPEFLYPADIHSVDFRLGTSLVARVEEKPVGFLFGFYKFGGTLLPADWHDRFGGALRIESQTLGVLPEYRGARIGFLLKKVQAEQALRAGVRMINWTVDPLQWPNAVLNFGLLRAIAFDFTPDYYPFRNDLNRVAASRFSLTWLVDTARVRAALDAEAPQRTQAQVIDLSQQPEIVQVNQGWEKTTAAPTAARIAIEIPANWTALQRDHLDDALRWRETTDDLFQQYIGRQPGQYVVTGVGLDGERRFLVAERAHDELWVRLSLHE